MRGPPKVPWAPFDAELQRRFQTGEALPTVEEEAKHLAGWAPKVGVTKTFVTKNSGTALGYERIRERIKKRYGGAAGYKATRDYFLMQLKSGKAAE